MIYCAVYHGNHGYNEYKRKAEELLSRMAMAKVLEEEFILNTDLLFLNEVETYFSDIFCPNLLTIPIEVIIENKKLPTIRIIRRILKYYMLKYKSTYMHKGRYRMKVWNE